jgi:hypothetical protein
MRGAVVEVLWETIDLLLVVVRIKVILEEEVILGLILMIEEETGIKGLGLVPIPRIEKTK